MSNNPTANRDIESLNQNIMQIDLDSVTVESMEQRIELTLAALFDADLLNGPGEPGEPCSQFTCNTYI